ncbi:MAG: cyanophycin synthetase [Betaproteobacteria bacterium]|nr:cyanophycin synthetase [Betaproteobacteria bacterium]
MEVTRVRALRGPNLWSRHTALELVVLLDAHERSIDQMPGFEARLRARFPGIGPIRPIGHTGLLPAARALEFALLRLQAEAGCAVTFSHTAPTVKPESYRVIVEYTEEAVGRLALRLACELYEAALADRPFDLDAALKQLHDLDEDVRLGPSTGAIVHAAVARGIPYRRLTEGSLVQFGWGRYQRRIQAAEIDSTSAIAESIAQDKELSKSLLAAAGVPVPDGVCVDTLKAAVAAMERIGAPVVVKPRDGNQGKGVTTNIVTRDHLEIAFRVAQEYETDVIVERFVPGHDHRLLVVGNRLVAAARREPPHVIGDGRHTIRQLVEQVNADPRRGEGHATSLTKIRFDDIAHAWLRIQGFEPDSIPPKGARVVLRNNANLSTGGTATDVTDDVHAELAQRAVEAARTVGLDICGVDVVCQTVSQSLESQNGAIVEVNAAPGLRMHIHPSYGRGRDVGEAIVRDMFGDHGDARVPVVAVTGTNGKTTVVRLTTAMIAASGLCVGMTNTDGVFIGGRQIDSGDCSGPRSARNVLMHPDVEAAVLETARGGLLREGLGFDRCSVAIVTNVGKGDHLGLNYIETVEELTVLKRVIVQNVAPHGVAVLNAADPRVASMASVCPGSVTFFARNPGLPVIAEHRARGRRSVYTDRGDLVAAEGRREVRRIPLSAIPLTRGGTLPFQVENVLASVAAAWAVDVPWPGIESALARFESDAATVPGRFNEFAFRGAKVIADYGHNPDAILALAQALEAIPSRRRMIVISAAGDRRDQDILDQAQVVGEGFDDVILYQDAAQRGRADGEVLALLRAGLKQATRTRSIEEIRGEFAAIDAALARLQSGDVCLILIDQVEEALAHIAKRVAEN